MRTITNTQVLLVAMAVASMDHRGIDAVLKDMRQHPEDAKVQEKGCKALVKIDVELEEKRKEEERRVAAERAAESQRQQVIINCTL